ncbi:MAG: hypothetical protein WCO11_01705 [Sphingomonadales bacterium]|jgi:hypothetical protein
MGDLLLKRRPDRPAAVPHALQPPCQLTPKNKLLKYQQYGLFCVLQTQDSKLEDSIKLVSDANIQDKLRVGQIVRPGHIAWHQIPARA